MLRLIISGDIMLGAKRIGESPDAHILREFGGADLIVGNLESPIVRHVPSRPNLNKIPLWSTAENMHVLKEFRFTHLCLNNNHAFDLFEQGLDDTIGLLKDADITGFGIAYNGLLQFEVLERKGIRLGMLAANWVQTQFNSHLFKDLRDINVKKAKEHVDFLICFFHWGDDHNIFINREQQQTARKLIDQGVDLVIGTHPHVPQGWERYKGKYIFYSLGNFIFTPKESYDYLPYKIRYDNHRENVLFQRIQCKIGLYVKIILRQKSYEVAEIKPVYREDTLPAGMRDNLVPYVESLIARMNDQIKQSDYGKNDAERKRILTSYTLPFILTRPWYWPMFLKKITLQKTLWFLRDLGAQ